MHRSTYLPISVGRTQKRDMRSQFAALCYRTVKDKPQVLLITSRDTGRWIVPKGWPMDGKTPHEAAAVEAFEEAGARGRVFDHVLGMYSYEKQLDDGSTLPCIVTLFPFKVQSLVSDYPEAGERKRKWFSPRKAATKVDEPELARILAQFDPRLSR
ncbi:NUDIX hydrolase [Actibacterium ureilyticum]|uniref:NUDIX hydrolase n=1 Tax=Actibacterium ureilyticum TaxID=1590614 RepID=UPI0031838B81